MKPVETDTAHALEEVSFARRDGLPLEVEVLRLEELLRPPFSPKTTRPTRSRFHTLLLVEGGTSSHHVDFERYSVSPGHLLVIPEGHVHAFNVARVISGYMALFTSDLLDRCGLRVGGLAESGDLVLQAGVHLRLGDGSHTKVRHAFATLANQTRFVTADRFADEAIASALSLLVFTVAGLPETTAAVIERVPHDELVAQFLETLDARFRVMHQASAYARDLRVSSRTLDRHLMAVQGQTARQIISARLVLEAKRMLTKRDMPVKNIAYELGFSEPQNFTRFFRTQTGLSPQAFREAL